MAELLNTLQRRLMEENPELDFLYLGKRSPDEVTVSMIRIREDFQGRGHGSRIMGFIAAEADKLGWKLSLVPSVEMGSDDLPRLKQFYRRLGFSDDDSGGMTRLPA